MVRTCALTRTEKPVEALVRFVVGPDDVLVPDVDARAEGRGVWISLSHEAVAEAVKKKAFARSLKAQVSVAEDLADLTRLRLEQRLLSALGMARKAGAAIIGFDQVRDYLRKQPPGYLIEASDGSEDGRNKVHFLAKAMYDTPNTAGALTSAELGMAFGRAHVIHALLQEGALSDSFGRAYQRLTGFRTAPERDWFSGRKR